MTTRTYTQWKQDRHETMVALQDKFPEAEIADAWRDMADLALDPDSGATTDDGHVAIEELVETIADQYDLYEEEDFGIPVELVLLAKLIDERLVTMGADQ